MTTAALYGSMMARKAPALAALPTAVMNESEVEDEVVATAPNSTAQTGERPDRAVATNGQTHIQGSGGEVVAKVVMVASCSGEREVAREVEVKGDGAMDKVVGEEDLTLNL